MTPRGRALALDAYEVLLDLERGPGEDTVRQLRTPFTDLRLERGASA
ncbi:hypothetical protein SAMN05660464_3517 [Geodermatophilus dictyosporus]|uniref:Uncharacterized protein n=1 Tax=Geodermatophilus dictyosporus TaxID=1523247 RepID=A0A1I5RFY1_9ACTN|nr:hypothetical protein [Geodermatophilus dictyosporus]SFP57227.1 hypothetical protein SAMN05660464_3517 [Geodermatophilus dictyosporus]